MDSKTEQPQPYRKWVYWLDDVKAAKNPVIGFANILSGYMLPLNLLHTSAIRTSSKTLKMNVLGDSDYRYISNGKYSNVELAYFSFLSVKIMKKNIEKYKPFGFVFITSLQIILLASGWCFYLVH